MSSAPATHGHDAHDDHAFTGEPVETLAPDEPRTPGWLPLLGVALFTGAAVLFLASRGEQPPGAAPAGADAPAAAPAGQPPARVEARPAAPPPARAEARPAAPPNPGHGEGRPPATARPAGPAFPAAKIREATQRVAAPPAAGH